MRRLALGLAAAGYRACPVTSGGTACAQDVAVSAYAKHVRLHLARQKHYPAEANRLALQGTAIVAFTVQPGGDVSDIRLVRSSGSAILDDQVQSMVLRANPFPSRPMERRSGSTRRSASECRLRDPGVRARCRADLMICRDARWLRRSHAQ
jgi:TonB family protein